ncbi:MAG: hypothetical protein EOO65_02625 [Methanosarcinales archaeon]|nr:MAG: hypothetical protein EOO65_02625 [Methanosarcinales archaeon]
MGRNVQARELEAAAQSLGAVEAELKRLQMSLSLLQRNRLASTVRDLTRNPAPDRRVLQAEIHRQHTALEADHRAVAALEREVTSLFNDLMEVQAQSKLLLAHLATSLPQN